jgi:hypothetical protein
MRRAKRFAGICLGLFFVAAAGQFAARQLDLEQPRLAEDETHHATSALTETAIPADALPLKTRRDLKRTRCATLEIEENGALVFRAQCPVGKTRCPWVSVADDALRVSGGYLPAQNFPIGPDSAVTCEEIMDDGSLVLRSLLPETRDERGAEPEQPSGEL